MQTPPLVACGPKAIAAAAAALRRLATVGWSGHRKVLCLEDSRRARGTKRDNNYIEYIILFIVLHSLSPGRAGQRVPSIGTHMQSYHEDGESSTST